MLRTISTICSSTEDTWSSREDKKLPNPPTRFYRIHRWTSLLYHRYVDTHLRRFESYRFGLLFCAMSCGVVFLVNLSVTIWAARKYPLSNGIGTMYDGSCDKTQLLSTWLHVAINALSTLLLGCSNYTMQCLSAPTRAEVNEAHARGTWLDIGISSLRNLRKISV